MQDLEIDRSRSYRIGREVKYSLKALWWWAVILLALGFGGYLFDELCNWGSQS